MNTKDKIITILSYSVLVLIKEVTFIPTIFTIILHVIVCLSTLVALYYTYSYYGSLPAAKATALTFSMQLVMVVTGN